MIEIHNNLFEYFKDLVCQAIRNQNMETDETTEFYLVHLLNEFQTSDKLHNHCPKTGDEEPFAITYLRASQEQPSQRMTLLKNLGDLSLYLSGCFAEHLRAKAAGLDYYISIGGNAYTRVASLIPQRNGDLQDLFQQLAENFSAFVDILSEVSEASGLQQNSDLLRVYEQWLRTGCEKAAKTLLKAGIPLTGPNPFQLQ